jgi:hypothetical protein
MEWRHASSPTKTKFNQTTLTQKIMCTEFWDRKGVLLVDLCLKAPQSMQVSVVAHLQNYVALSRISNVACLAEVLW